MCYDGFVNLFEAIMMQAYEDANVVERKLAKGLKVTKADVELQTEARDYIEGMKQAFANW